MSTSSEDLTKSMFLAKSNDELNSSCDDSLCGCTPPSLILKEATEEKTTVDEILKEMKSSEDSEKVVRNVSPVISESSEKIFHSGFVKRMKDGKLHDKQFETGDLIVTYGSMKAGKSTNSIGYANRMSTLGLDTCYIISTVDTRSEDEIKSFHDSGKVSLSQKVKVIRTKFLSDIYSELLKYTVIVIDEGQFFDDIIQVESLVLREKKLVYISALDADANLNRFGRVHEVIHLCSPGNLNKISALCVDCASIDHRSEKAGFTFHLGKRISADSQIHIGSDEYIALCLKHHQLRSKEQEKH